MSDRKESLPPMTAGALCIAALALAFSLAACGGGGSKATGMGEMSSLDRLQAMVERADTLLSSQVRARYTVTVDGETVSEPSWSIAVTCTGARCAFADGEAVTVEDRAPPAALPKEALGTRGGFDTLVFESRFPLSREFDGGTITAASEVTHYGFWGKHGYAGLALLGDGSLTGTWHGSPLEDGAFSMAGAWVLGDASDTNPAGTGSATWTGIAEAATTDTFERLQGTATVTVPDLSRPRIGVAIEVPGHTIGAPGWADMALTNGRFAAGRAGADYLAGSLHGPAHQEAWGVFDTTGYVGAFGARRAK